MKTTKSITIAHFLCLLFASIGIYTSGQSGSVGIGTPSPNNSALLDLTATDKGLLLPRISLASTGIWGLTGTSVAGMVVYNTNVSITSSSSTNALSAGAYPTTVNKIGVYTWDRYGWVAQNSTAEVMKIAFPAVSGSTATGMNTLLLSTPAFNTISGATVTPSTGAISVPAGTYRISTSISCTLSNTTTNFQYLELMVSNVPNGQGDVLGLYVQPSNMPTGYVNGSSIMKVGAGGGNIYFTIYINNLAAGGTWSTSTASPQSYATIERIH